MSGLYTSRDTCRLCKSRNIVLFLDMGVMPHAGQFLEKKDVGHEPAFPLKVYFCKDCGLVQLADIVSPEYLFTKYNYLSAVTKTLSDHFRDYAKEMAESFLGKNAVIVEIGSNDGVLQKPLTELGARAIGVEPSKNVSKIAQEKGLEVINGFFTKNVAESIVKSAGKVDAVFANNVFAHIDNMDEVMEGIKIVLKPGGVYVFEVHYLMDLIEGLQYDTIYHEHLCYHSLSSLIPFFKKYGMDVFDVKRIPIHAGSVRVYVRNGTQKQGRNVEELLRLEKEMGLDRMETLAQFSEKVRAHKKSLTGLLVALKKEGKKIYGYGAPGRGNTLLNYCGIGTSLVDLIIDESPLRYGRYTPGTHIPILPPSEVKSQPDIYLMLAWSYEKEILGKSKEFIGRGGKFIVPLPEIRTIP